MIRGSLLSLGNVVVLVGIEALLRVVTCFQVVRFPAETHLKDPADVVRNWPTFLQDFPAIEVACGALGETAVTERRIVSGSGIATGNTPVNAAMPTEMD